MTSVRAAKSKGSNYEMDCAESLRQLYPDLQRLGKEGFQHECDLIDKGSGQMFECKRLKAMSWNQAKKYFLKLKSIADDEGYSPKLLFQSNRQPCLVMYSTEGELRVTEFETFYGVPFIKHESTRRKK